MKFVILLRTFCDLSVFVFVSDIFYHYTVLYIDKMPRKTLRKHGKGTKERVHRKTQKGGFNPNTKKSGKRKGKGKRSLKETSPR